MHKLSERLQPRVKLKMTAVACPIKHLFLQRKNENMERIHQYSVIGAHLGPFGCREPDESSAPFCQRPALA